MGRREITSGITLVVLVAVLAAGAWYGWSSLTSGSSAEETPAAGADASSSPDACTTSKVRRGSTLTSKKVTVSVFNAGSREGLATEVLDKLKKRGFRAGSADNAPGGVNVDVVSVQSVVRQDPAARLVARQFGTKVTVVGRADDLGRGVDVVVGEDFKRLKKRAVTSIKVKRGAATCTTGG